MNEQRGVFPRIKEYQVHVDNVHIERFLVIHAACTLTPTVLKKGPTDSDGAATFTMVQSCSHHNVQSASFLMRMMVELRSV